MILSFARPWLLLLLLAIPWWWIRRRRQQPVVAVVSATAPFAEATHGRWRLRVPPALRAVALASLLIAAAGPFRPGDRTVVSTDGIAIVIAIDVSSSMLAEDFAPSNRIEVAKQQAIAFVRARSNDRIGLVTFAGEALTQVPVTLDYATLIHSIEQLRVGMLGDGTAIGSGLATAVARLRKVPGKSKVVLLLTDGVNNQGLVDPRTAAQAAEAFGVRVYTVGVGTEGEARIPTGGPGGYRYEMLPVSIDEPLLTDIANRTGGKYFRAKDSEALRRIFQQVDRLERTPVDVVRYTQADERTMPFVALGLVLLAVELWLSGSYVVRVP